MDVDRLDVTSTSASPARRSSKLSVNEVVPSRLVRTEISSTSSKRAGAFHSMTWRTVWHLEGAVEDIGRARQRGAQELEAGEVDVVAVARVEDHVLGVALLVAHAQIVAERRASWRLGSPQSGRCGGAR